MKISFKKFKIQPGVTPIDNLFLDIYLPIVDEVSLKVYLFLYKRLYGSYIDELTIDTISNELGFSEIQIKNAFKFWQNNGVLDFETENGVITEVEFYNFYALYSGTLSVEEEVVKEKALEKPLLDNSKYILKIENLIGLTLQPHEIDKILDCIEETGQGWDLVYRAYLYADEKKKSKSSSYIVGILRGWKRDNGIVTEQDLDNHLKKKDIRKNYTNIKSNKSGYLKKITKDDIEKFNVKKKSVMDTLDDLYVEENDE